MVSAAPLSTATSAQVYLNQSSRGGCVTSSDIVASAATDVGGVSPAITMAAGGALATRDAVEAGWALTGTETVETGGELTIWGGTIDVAGSASLILKRMGG